MSGELDGKGLPDPNDVSRWNAEAEAHALETLRASQGLAASSSPSEMEVVALVDDLRSVNARHEWFKANGLMQQAAGALDQAQSALAAMRAERDSWRRVAEKLEGEKRTAEARVKALEEALRPLLHAAMGLSHGSDWNKGNHAIKHGYRQRLLDAIPAARSALKENADG